MKPEVGDKIRLKITIRDSYQEVYYDEGDVTEIWAIDPEQTGYEYQIGHGFCIGEKDFEHMPRITEGPYSWVHQEY